MGISGDIYLVRAGKRMGTMMYERKVRDGVERLWNYTQAFRNAMKGLSNVVKIVAQRPSPSHPLSFKRMECMRKQVGLVPLVKSRIFSWNVLPMLTLSST